MDDRIGLLTLDSRTYNYGGILQEYALSQFLEQERYPTEIIDFDTASETGTFSVKRGLRNLSMGKVWRKLRNRISQKNAPDISQMVAVRHQRFDRFREQFLHLSRCYTAKNINNAVKEYNTFICGSDQIWNPDYNIPEFFLNFAGKDQNKIIYGASLGRDSLTRRQSKVYHSLMSDLDYISVRESNAKDILQPLTAIPIEVVLDPTLLFPAEFWRKVKQIPLGLPESFLFCYFLNQSPEKQKAAIRIAKQFHLKIVTIPYLHDQYEYLSEEFGDEQRTDIGPQEFLGLIDNAKIVLTDSFHATVFSILFRKDFWTFERTATRINMNARISNLLSFFQLGDRKISVNDMPHWEPCRYQDTYTTFKQYQSSSGLFLKKALHNQREMR